MLSRMYLASQAAVTLAGLKSSLTVVSPTSLSPLKKANFRQRKPKFACGEYSSTPLFMLNAPSHPTDLTVHLSGTDNSHRGNIAAIALMAAIAAAFHHQRGRIVAARAADDGFHSGTDSAAAGGRLLPAIARCALPTRRISARD